MFIFREIAPGITIYILFGKTVEMVEKTDDVNQVLQMTEQHDISDNFETSMVTPGKELTLMLDNATHAITATLSARLDPLSSEVTSVESSQVVPTWKRITRKATFPVSSFFKRKLKMSQTGLHARFVLALKTDLHALCSKLKRKV